MLSFEEFVRSPRCRKLQLKDEDQPQDAKEWRRLEKEDQEKQYESYITQLQYERYRTQFEPKGESKEAEEELRKLSALRNQKNGLRNSYVNKAEYMKMYREKRRNCPHCGKEIVRKKTKI